MTDIKHTTAGDIDLSTSDIAYEESTYQHQQDIILSDKGHYKETPTVGVGISQYIHETDPENMLRSIRKEFAADGMTVRKIAIENANIITNAKYGNDKS